MSNTKEMGLMLIKNLLEEHLKQESNKQNRILALSAQMFIDLHENNPTLLHEPEESLQTLFEVWCIKRNFSVAIYVHPSGKESYDDSRTRRAWYAVKDLIQRINEAKEELYVQATAQDSGGKQLSS